jgi:hypothetical protein
MEKHRDRLKETGPGPRGKILKETFRGLTRVAAASEKKIRGQGRVAAAPEKKIRGQGRMAVTSEKTFGA